MIKKNITFIYSSAAEQQIYSPIYEEAIKRGYQAKMSDNPHEKCEIGFYCQHINFPRNSKFSIIMLHDSIQQKVDWPDIWFKEHWNKYDIGILPDNDWENNYNQCSQFFYTNPRLGVFKIGWPKADNLIVYKHNSNNFKEKYGINNNKKTILYAPSYENDNKQDDFVQACHGLDVNILIKYHPNIEKNTKVYKNVLEMAEKHKNIKNITVLPSVTNIFEAITASDILVSDGSSTMYEAAMACIPSILVTNWLCLGPELGDFPSTYPSKDYNFVIETKKESLHNTIDNILNNYDTYKQNITQYSNTNFYNIGNCSKIIMDIIDDYINNKKIRYKPLERKPKHKLSIKKYILTQFWAVSTYLFEKYFSKNKFLTKISYKLAGFIRSKKIMQ